MCQQILSSSTQFPPKYPIHVMKLALKSKNKLKVVAGSLIEPQLGCYLHEPWDKCNTMVLFLA